MTDEHKILGMSPFEWLKAGAMLLAIAAAFFTLKGRVDVHDVMITDTRSDLDSHKREQREDMNQVNKKLDRILERLGGSKR